jgi:hypothetical protein
MTLNVSVAHLWTHQKTLQLLVRARVCLLIGAVQSTSPPRWCNVYALPPRPERDIVLKLLVNVNSLVLNCTNDTQMMQVQHATLTDRVKSWQQQRP